MNLQLPQIAISRIEMKDEKGKAKAKSIVYGVSYAESTRLSTTTSMFEQQLDLPLILVEHVLLLHPEHSPPLVRSLEGVQAAGGGV